MTRPILVLYPYVLHWILMGQQDMRNWTSFTRTKIPLTCYTVKPTISQCQYNILLLTANICKYLPTLNFRGLSLIAMEYNFSNNVSGKYKVWWKYKEFSIIFIVQDMIFNSVSCLEGIIGKGRLLKWCLPFNQTKLRKFYNYSYISTYLILSNKCSLKLSKLIHEIATAF